jgi:hypothetical protein
MSCYSNNSCYNPVGSSCYPNTNYLGSMPQPCKQTVFRAGNCNGVGPTVTITGGALGASLGDGSCTDYTSIQITGSGLSIVSICVGTGTGTTTSGFKTAVAGVICSCPNNFTSTILIDKNLVLTGVASIPTGQLVGCINWCVCGCNVCGSGTISGISDADGGATLDLVAATGTVQIMGTACSACGTRTICINSISINAS